MSSGEAEERIEFLAVIKFMMNIVKNKEEWEVAATVTIW